MKTKTVKLTNDELRYLQTLIGADMYERERAFIHAVSHGTDYSDPGLTIANRIVVKFSSFDEG